MTAKQNHITGWDIGGAHLKVARCDPTGQLVDVIEVSCPLWQGIEELKRAIKTVQQQLINQSDIAAITMTGELVDIFPDRQTGVAAILECLSEFIPEHLCHIYAGELGWFSPSQAKQNWQNVASRNWQATASYVAKQVNNGLLIDIGSTTCDIIPLKDQHATPSGFSDHERQLSRELIYTGAIRTPLFALCNSAPFQGQLVSLAAEVFATTADCWRLLNKLDETVIHDDSSDGKPWTEQNCSRRLARLIGTDSNQYEITHWRQLAQWFAHQQIQQITNGCLQVLSAHPELANAPIIGAGVGRFIAQQCAQLLDKNYIDFSSLVSSDKTGTADHAPAVAVALLAWQQLT